MPHLAALGLPLLGMSLVLASCAAPDAGGSIAPGALEPSTATEADAGPATMTPGQPGTSPSTPSRPGEPEFCERVETAALPIAPRMLILADRSNSMTQTTGAAKCPPCFESRWDGSVGAIKSVASELEDAIDFGLMLFPSVKADPKGGDASCQAGVVSVGTRTGAAAEIAGVLDMAKPGGATPTAKALIAAKRVLVDDIVGQPDVRYSTGYVLLVTDGEPTCEDLDLGIKEPDATHAALGELLEAGVPTYVVGYGIGKSFGPGPVMDEMARHGGTEHFYPAEGQTELVAALREISASIVSCDFALERDPPRGDAYIHVTLDGKDVAQGPEGWTRKDRAIRLAGAACDKLRDGKPHGLEIAVECEPVQIF